MCIRDRFHTCHAHCPPCVQGSPHGHWCFEQAQTRPGSRRLARLACVCLLYTSDAADERSSVDLGGRRIIKKKKRQTKVRGSELQQHSQRIL